MEFVSKEVEDIMGYSTLEFGIPFMNEKIHPEDHSWFLTFGNSVIDFISQ